MDLLKEYINQELSWLRGSSSCNKIRFCWVALRIWPSVSRQLEISSGLWGPYPGLLPPSGVWVYCLVPEAPLIRGMPTGPKIFLAMPGVCGLRPTARTHQKKGLVLHLHVRWVVQQIPSSSCSKHLACLRVR